MIPWWKIKIMNLIGFHVMNSVEELEYAERIIGRARKKRGV